jgi:predicted RNA-binding protein with PIN domain
MPYLIDGHNLIPKIPGLNLQALDDEEQLIKLLQEYCRRQRKQVEVFFDNAPPGGGRARNFGRVIAWFVRQGSTADQEISKRLTRLGRLARNWTVVSSDRAVQRAARAAQARPMPAEAFAMLLIKSLDEQAVDQGGKPEAEVGTDELEDWLKLFGEQEPDSEK